MGNLERIDLSHILCKPGIVFCSVLEDEKQELFPAYFIIFQVSVRGLALLSSNFHSCHGSDTVFWGRVDGCVVGGDKSQGATEVTKLNSRVISNTVVSLGCQM